MDVMAFPRLPLSDPVSAFAAVLLLLLGVPILTGKLRIPSIVGLLLAGIAIGPGGLDLVSRTGIIELLGTVGAVYAVFLAGVEIDLGPLRKNRGQGLAFGLAAFLLPFAAGFGVGFFLLGRPWPTAVVLGAVLSSHGLLTFPTADRLGLRRSRPAFSAAAGTIVADALGLAALAFLGARANAWPNPLLLGRMAVVAAALIVFGLLFLPRVSGFFLTKLRPDGTVEFIYAMAALFLFAAIAGLGGVEPIIGAFIAGLALNAMIPEKSALMNRINSVGYSLFIPFFLVSAGMLVDLRSFASDGGAAAIAMAISAPLSTYLAASVFRITHRYSRGEAVFMFGLTANRAAVALALAMAGHGLGLLGSAELGAAVAVILVTCLIGPWATRSGARALALEAKGTAGGEVEANDRILVMVSNPERTRHLMDLAFMLRPKDSSDPVYPVNVVQDSPEVDRDSASSEKLLAQIVVHGVSSGVNVIPVTRLSYNVAEGVVRAAQEVRASAIIAGAGPGSQFQKLPYGRVIDQIMRSSRQMLFVDKLPRAIKFYNSIIAVAPPLSERQRGFRQAASAIKSLAGDLSAKLTLVTLAHGGAPLKAEFAAVKPQIAFHDLFLNDWRELESATRRHAGPSSFYALLNVRPGSLAWQPAVDRLPSELLEDNPDAAMLCLYLPELTEEARPAAAEPAESDEEESLFGAALRAGRVRLWEDPLPMADAIRSLLAAAFPKDRALSAKLTAVFADIAQKEPVELKPGIVLLHAHVPDVQERAVLFGLSVPGIPLLSLQEAIRILVVLVAPESSPPEEHLQTLAKLAGFVMDPGVSERLLAARSSEDLASIESEGGRLSDAAKG